MGFKRKGIFSTGKWGFWYKLRTVPGGVDQLSCVNLFMQFPVPEVLDLMYVGSIGMCSVSSEPEGKSALPWCEAECTPCVLLNVNALDSWRSQRTNRAARGELFPKESVLMSFNHV